MSDSPRGTRTERKIWQPAHYSVREILAVQALARYAQSATTAPGEENETPAPSATACKLALDWIINAAAATYDNGFVANDPSGRIAAFIDGRQSVGQQIVKLMKLKPELFEEKL
jgi:hypothetical protein